MAAGKSSVGKRLASELEYSFFDLDEEVVARTGRAIGRIFAEEGEAAFRRHEDRVLEAMLEKDDAVVALGGGTVLSESNRRKLRERGLLVWLNTPRSTILARLAEAAGDRPLFEDGDQVVRLLEARIEAYRDCDIEVRPVAGESVVETALRIAEQVK